MSKHTGVTGMTDHTPGWTVKDGANSYFFDMRVMDGTECVAFCDGEYARLIAAAPKLLEALQGLVADVGFRGAGPESHSKFYCEICHLDQGAYYFRDVIHDEECPVTKARAAIAEAMLKERAK